MKFIRRHIAACTLAALAATAGNALAQDKYPSKPVTVIVPQAPGGANDAIARIVAQKLTEALGQQFIVDNKPGAGGNIGTAAAAKGKNDGYTLMLTVNSAHVINPSLYKSTGFDPVKDFDPISPVAASWPRKSTRASRSRSSCRRPPAAPTTRSEERRVGKECA